MRDDDTRELHRRLCQILTWGLHEIQSEVVIPNSERRIQDLANILELIPPMLAGSTTDQRLETLNLELQRYQRQYPDSPYSYTSSIEEFLLVSTL